MKQRSTTPASERFLTYVLLALSALSIISFYMIATTHSVSAEKSTQQKIDDLSKKIDSNEKKADTLNKRGKSLSSTLAQLDRQSTDVTKKLATTKSSQIDLEKEVSATKKQLQKQQKLLGKLLADQYVSGNATTLEMLASSHNLADFFDQQAYQTAIRSNVNSAIDSVKQHQKSLATKQLALKRTEADISAQHAALQEQSKEKQALLTQTNGQEASYKKLSKKQSEEREKLQTEQQASLNTAMSGASMVESVPVDDTASEPTAAPSVSSPSSGSSSGSSSAPSSSKPKPKPSGGSHVSSRNGGYPSYLNNCYVDAYAMSYGIDPWGYGCRQCVSYTAWKVYQKTGRTASYWGNAKQWPSSARARGYKVSSTPRAGSVGVMTSGPYGHVVWVESVNSNGTINISQYNYYLAGKGWGYYSAFKNVSRYAYDAYIYF